jgi:hypothetical protein
MVSGSTQYPVSNAFIDTKKLKGMLPTNEQELATFFYILPGSNDVELAKSLPSTPLTDESRNIIPVKF